MLPPIVLLTENVPLAPSGAVAAATPLQVSRLYNGVDRPFPITIARGVTDLKLLRSVTAEPIATGKPNADLARSFPDLWKHGSEGVIYLQAYNGAKPVGSAVVLQPMNNPQVSTLDSATKAPKFEPDEDQAFTGYRAYTDQHAIFRTSLGEMEFRMRPDCAPNTAFNLLELVRGGYYEGTIIHRIVNKGRDGNPFVIQGGDPTGTGSGGPGYAIPLEDSKLPHDFGVLSMARSTDPNTAGSQWFVALSRAATARLDRKYASFGELVRGAETLRKIAALPVGEADRPLRPPVIQTAKLVPAPTYTAEVTTFGKPAGG